MGTMPVGQSAGSYSQQVSSNEAGIVDLGPLPTGHYGLCAMISNVHAMRTQLQVFLGPGDRRNTP